MRPRALGCDQLKSIELWNKVPVYLSCLVFTQFVATWLMAVLQILSVAALVRESSQATGVSRTVVSPEDIEARMVLGDAVSSTMYPFIVRISITFSNDSSYNKNYDDVCPDTHLRRDRKKPMHPKEPGRTCVGSVVSRKHVLTAGRCIWPLKLRPVYTVYYGSAVWNEQKPTRVIRAVRHPGCRSFGQGRRLVNDVAVLETEQEFPARLDAVSLPQNLGNISGRVVETAGWGNTDEEEEARLNHSDHLQRVTLRLRTSQRCKEAYPSADLKGQICATAKDGQPHLDDFGAPLLLATDDWYVVGVFSWFRLRDFPTSPFVFASTAHYAPWIKSVIGNSSGEEKPK
ncbi:chymase-like [Amblyomma americanum]